MVMKGCWLEKYVGFIQPPNCSAFHGIYNHFQHGRPQKIFHGGYFHGGHFAYLFQIADDSVQMDVHKTFYPLCTQR